jgi:hypothetical protein
MRDPEGREGSPGPSASRRPPPSAPRATRRRVLTVVAILACWFAAGLLRADGAARGFFADAHGAGVTVARVTVDGLIPVPPFWAVTISGDVIEAGQTSPSYRSYMILLVEPLSGWGAVLGSG